MLVRKYDNKDINSMVTIWNEVVENGVAVDDNAVVCISVKNWYQTVYYRQKNLDLRYCSLTPWWKVTSTQDTYMNESDLSSLERFLMVSE